MLHPLIRAVASCAIVGASLVGSSEARAQDGAPMLRRASARTPREGSSPPRDGQDDTRRPVAVTLNLLAVAMDRYGANLELSPAPHHAVAGSAYYQSLPIWAVRAIAGQDAIKDRGATSFGGELGYRYYTGRRGADGFFVGGSFVAMPLAYPRVSTDFRSIELRHFIATGAALDIGVQKVFGSGFTLGGGAGVMYLGYDVPSDNRRVLSGFEPHVLPRLLLMAGWSF